MVGELVIAQTMVAEDPNINDGQLVPLARKVSHADKIIRELQDLTMALRMVPLKGTFQKMARLVRDLARKSDKTVKFITEGEDTEIDRNMVEALNDPLVHMIRNAVDHGIESKEDRIAAGKPELGTVQLHASHAAGSVVIELRDDGKGLNHDKIVAKAMDRGLIDSARDITENDVFGLIFQPGFSTADKITNVSGRGVGMDVVKKGIEALRGRIDLTSKPGLGTTFSIRLPLTMAIIDAMLVQVGGERYLIPTIEVDQSFRPKSADVSTVAGRTEVVMFRGNILPIVRLQSLFGIENAVERVEDGLLIVLTLEGQRCAMMVDQLLGQQQVVIKSLGDSMSNVPGISGGAILGDGSVGLILDVSGLLSLAQDSMIVGIKEDTAGDGRLTSKTPESVLVAS